MSKSKERYVLVTTQYRGVFAGVLVTRKDSVVTLGQARMCVRWGAAMRGVLGLAVAGPDQDCRIGPAVEKIELIGVTSITNIGDAARTRWEAAPWWS